MKHLCIQCNYSTNIKSNYNKHLKTLSHSIIVDNQQVVNSNTEYAANYKEKLKCKKCPKIFSCKQSLSYHKLNSCKGQLNNTNNTNNTNNNNIPNEQVIALVEQNKQLIEQTNNYMEQNNNLVQLFTEYIKDNKSAQPPTPPQPINNSFNNTYNVSIKNYLQQNHADAPALEGLPDYATIKYIDNDENDEEPDKDDFANTLSYNYNNSCLPKYLGDFIIQHYKKSDPKQQSMWSSDISRLTYIIKELLANNDSMWAHDHKGVKTKTYIIDPLLKYIREYIDSYWIEKLEDYKRSKLDNFNKYHAIYVTLYKIKKNIENDVLGNDIIRYIAPHFYMDRKNKKNKNTEPEKILHFIDDDIL